MKQIVRTKTKTNLKMRLCLSYLFAIVLFASCIPANNNRSACIDNIIENNLRDSTFKQVYRLINDTILQWKQNNINGYVNITINNYQLDSCILINKSKTMCLAFLSKTLSDDSPFDAVSYIGGVKYDDKWYFFYQGYTTYYFRRTQNSNKKYTLNQLSILGRSELINDLFLTNNCNVNEQILKDEINRTLEWDIKAKNLAPHFGIKPYYHN